MTIRQGNESPHFAGLMTRWITAIRTQISCNTAHLESKGDSLKATRKPRFDIFNLHLKDDHSVNVFRWWW